MQSGREFRGENNVYTDGSVYRIRMCGGSPMDRRGMRVLRLFLPKSCQQARERENDVSSPFFRGEGGG
jgi:hypothetical protein